MGEVRTTYEGSLRWAQASANTANGTRVWTTASAAPTGLIGYVTNFSFSPRNRAFMAIADRGDLKHWKAGAEQPLDVSFDVMLANTAEFPPTAVTAGGTTVPQVHLELRMAAPEVGATSAIYVQLCGVVFPNPTFAEGEQNTLSWRGQALATPHSFTASGYLG